MEQDLVPHSKILQAHRSKLTIGNGNNGSIEGSKFRRPKANVFYCPLKFTSLAVIPYPDRLVRYDHDPSEQVFQGLLGSESYGNTTYTQSGNDCSED